MLNDLEKGKNLNQNVLFRKVPSADISNIVVVHRYIFIIYFRLTLTLPLVE